MKAKLGMMKKMTVGLLAGVMTLNPILASAASARSTAPPPAKAAKVRLQGVAKLSGPVAHGTVRVLDRSGNVLVEREDATNENGYFSIEAPVAKTDGLVLAVTGGESGEGGFDGTLLGEVASKNGRPRLAHLNAATTLSVHVQADQPWLSSDEAASRVKRFLDLPQEMNLGFDLENPHQRLFSSAEFENAANEAGSWDRYVELLALEVSRQDGQTLAFPAPGTPPAMLGNPYAIWVGEKLIGAAVGSAGSQIFSKLQEAIGIPDGTSKILDLLNQVMGRLIEIQRSLDRIEEATHQSNYDGRVSKLWSEYADFKEIMDEIQETNVTALNNIGKDGKIKDPKIAEDVKKAAEEYRQAVIDLDMKFVNHVHAEMIGDGISLTPLGKVFATARWIGAKPIITTDYFRQVYGQLERYRSYQALSAVILADAKRVDNPIVADNKIKVAKKYIDEEKVIFPDEPFFKSKHLDRVIDGTRVYDVNSGLVWETTYARFNSCMDLVNRYTRPTSGQFRVPSPMQIRDFLENARLGGRFVDIAKALGFNASEAQSTTMITVMCNPEMPPIYPEASYLWFGNDENPGDAHLHPARVYDAWKAAKKMTGIATLKVWPLFE